MSNITASSDWLKLTTQGDYACSWCGLLIPSKKSSRNTYDLQEWCSVEVAGLFCSSSHAIAATNDLQYRQQYLFQKEGK